MAKRRGNNEGCIYPQPSGKWRAQVSIQGKRLSKVLSTYKECQDWIRDANHKIDLGMTYKSSKITLSDYMADWLSIKSTEVREKTYHQYKSIAEKYIVPELGNKTLVDLTPYQIQRVYNNHLRAGIGERTVQYTHAILRACLNTAMKQGIISRNPTKVVSPPKPKQREIQVLDEAQIQILLLAAKEIQPEFFTLYQLAITTGMRLGELLGLKWEDIDWAQGSLTVKRQLQRKPNEGFIFNPPKTNAGRRTISLGNKSQEALHDHLSQQQGLMNGLVFQNSNGNPIGPRTVQKAFQKLLDASGLPRLRFHDLRHTSATQLLKNGVDVHTVSRRLGHAKTSITLDIYSHEIPGSQDRAAALMDEITTPAVLPQELIAHKLPTNAVSYHKSKQDPTQK